MNKEMICAEEPKVNYSPAKISGSEVTRAEQQKTYLEARRLNLSDIRTECTIKGLTGGRVRR